MSRKLWSENAASLAPERKRSWLTRPAGRPPRLTPGPQPAVRPRASPRWVKISGIAVVILVLVLVALTVAFGGGNHGPMRHATGITDG